MIQNLVWERLIQRANILWEYSTFLFMYEYSELLTYTYIDICLPPFSIPSFLMPFFDQAFSPHLESFLPADGTWSPHTTPSAVSRRGQEKGGAWGVNSIRDSKSTEPSSFNNARDASEGFLRELVSIPVSISVSISGAQPSRRRLIDLICFENHSSSAKWSRRVIIQVQANK